MIDLDDAVVLRAADPEDMLGTVLALGDHAREGYALGRAAAPLPSADGIGSVVFCGMGGSAIAGDVVRVLAAERLHVPVVVVRSPELPAFVGPHAVVIASSYSGNTAETLALFEEALARGCRQVVVTSGGELERRAVEEGIAVVAVPGGFMPRAAFGYLTLGTIGALVEMGLLPGAGQDLDDAFEIMERVVSVSGPDVSATVNPAKTLALRIGDRTPVIWGAEGIAAVAASRWKAEFNENAKVAAFASALPELDHNEVVGWSPGQGERSFLVALRHDGENPDVAARFPLSIDIARSSGIEAEEVRASGRSDLARLLELVQVGDLVSTYLGIVRGVDPSPIDAIERLKAALAEA